MAASLTLVPTASALLEVFLIKTFLTEDVTVYRKCGHSFCTQELTIVSHVNHLHHCGVCLQQFYQRIIFIECRDV